MPLPPLLAAAFALLSAAPVAAPPPERAVAVLEVRSSLAGEDRRRVDAAALAEKVREVARRALPDTRVLDRGEAPVSDGCAGDCEVAAARKAGADLVVTADLLRIDQGLLVSLELREARTGRLAAIQTALASTPEELTEAVAGAAADLFKPQRPSLTVGPDDLPEVPAAPGPLQESGVLDLEIDAGVLVAYDAARNADSRGKDKPDDAAAAWEAVAELHGKNPFRETAAARAAQWRTYAETRRAFEAQLAGDTAQLRKILPLSSVKESARLEMLGRYARAYGAERAAPLVALLPEGLRERAGLLVGCERRDADKCLALARRSAEAKDPRAEAEYLELACNAGSGGACADAGDRWLRAPAREPARAIPALQRGCAAGNAPSCARLARVYEEGDGTDANLVVAAQLRGQACAAGDGRSCRRLACAVDGESAPADQARALSLWQKGCVQGDPISCALARAASPQPAAPAAPAPTAAEAAAATRAAAAAQAASTDPAPPAKRARRARPAAAAPVEALTPPQPKHSARTAAGILLVGTGAVLAAGLIVSSVGDDHRSFRVEPPGRRFLTAEPAGRGRDLTGIALGAGAVLSTGIGLTLLLTRPEPVAPRLAVTAAPTGLYLSGTLP